MKEENEHIDELMLHVLSGEASVSEHDELRLLLQTSPEAKRQFEQWKALFDRSVPGTIQFNTDAAWKNVRPRLKGFAKVRNIGRFPVLRIAASVATLAGLSLLIYFFSGKDHLTYAAGTQVVNDTLPDGSQISLNKGSKLVYAYDKKQNRRTAKLAGEARFEVEHSESEKFVVEILDVFIEDMGTVFNVRSSSNQDTIEVSVSEGSVRFFNKRNEGLELEAGEMAYYVRSTEVFSTSGLADENAAAYADRIFRFRDTPLKQVVKKLNEVYDTRLELIGQQIGQCRITVTFEDESIDTIADVIAQTLGLEVQHVGKSIRLSGEGCE